MTISRTSLISLTATLALAFAAPSFAQSAAPAPTPATTATAPATAAPANETKAQKKARLAKTGSKKHCNPAKSKPCGNACIPLKNNCNIK